MPANPLIGGSVPFDVTVPAFSTISYAVVGFPFSATADPTSTTGMAGWIGIRKPAKLQLEDTVRNDVAGRDQSDSWMSKIEIDSWQTDITSLANTYLLSKQNVALAFQAVNGDWYNFVDNTAIPPYASTTASPNGSSTLGFEWVYEVSNKEATNKLMFAGKLHPLELDWELANTASRFAGNTGLSAITTASLSTMQYSFDNYAVPGFSPNFLTVSGDNIGLISDNAKVTLKSVAPVKDSRERPYPP